MSTSLKVEWLVDEEFKNPIHIIKYMYNFSKSGMHNNAGDESNLSSDATVHDCRR